MLPCSRRAGVQPVNDADTTRVAEGNMERWAAKLCDRRATAPAPGAVLVDQGPPQPSSTTTTTPVLAPAGWDSMAHAVPVARSPAAIQPWSRQCCSRARGAFGTAPASPYLPHARLSGCPNLARLVLPRSRPRLLTLMDALIKQLSPLPHLEIASALLGMASAPPPTHQDAARLADARGCHLQRPARC